MGDKFAYLKAFNKLSKETDIMYHTYAKKCGLSDMAFWILYSMAENETPFTQRDFCREWFFAPQTVNSALKDLEKKDIIFLEPVNKKNKLIKLTENGKEFIGKTILPLMQAECDCFNVFSEEEKKIIFPAIQRYVSALKAKID